MLQFNKKDIELFGSLIDRARSIVLIAHTNADGDAIGSILAVRRILAARTQAAVSCLLPTPPPNQFAFLDGFDRISSDADKGNRLLLEADLIVALDMNNAGRVDQFAAALTQSPARKVLIDHHHSPDTGLFDLLFSVPEFSSTCELAYWLFTALYGDDCIDSTTATFLYAGIGTDTGFFSYSCSQPSVFEAAARLVAKGIDPAFIHDTICNCFSIARLRFYGFAISERLRIIPECRAAFFYISLDDQRRFGMGPADSEGLVNYTLLMRDIEVGALIREEQGRVKASFRSKNDFDVSRFAHDLFGGGGHTRAAGSTSTLPFDETVALVEQKLRDSLASGSHQSPVCNHQ